MQDQVSPRVIAELSSDDHIVVAQATEAEPRELVPEGALANSEPENELVDATVEADEVAEDNIIVRIPDDFEVPGAGVRVTALVQEGSDVRLLDSAFDPRTATYAVDGGDLIVTLGNGGVLILENFFISGGQVNTLSLLDGPAVAATDLLERAETYVAENLDGTATEPAAGEQQNGTNTGGGAAFGEYDPGSMGLGLDPLGPIGPTELYFAGDLLDDTVDPTADRLADDDDGGGDGGGGDGGGDGGGGDGGGDGGGGDGGGDGGGGDGGGDGGGSTGDRPVLTLRPDIDATVVEQDNGYNPPSTPELPIIGEGERIPDDAINGIDQNILTLDESREVFVRFVDETSYSVDSLFVHEIAADGSMINVRAVFPYTNKPGQPFQPADLEPGTEVSLGTYEAGTQINFFLVNDGGRDNDPSIFTGGRFELRNALTGEPARIDDGQPPVLVHIADDDTETVVKAHALYGADSGQDTPNVNALNPDGVGHVVSGWDDATGSLIVGFEDHIKANKDNDFNDDVYAVRFGSVTQKTVYLTGEDADLGLGAQITDTDSTIMSGSTVWLTSNFDGDTLVLDESIFYGTNIRLDVKSANEIKLYGNDSIANYEKVISAIGIELGDDPEAGERTIEARVRDLEGNTSAKAETTIDVTDRILAGDDDDNTITGVSGSEVIDLSDGDDSVSTAGGDDTVYGRSGNDFINGGEGNDTLDGGRGHDTLVGGAGRDVLTGGRDGDVFRVTGLSDGTDTITDFNADDGDVLDLHMLLDGTGFDSTKANVDDFIRLSAADTDGDGDTDDITVSVDLDGNGSAHRMVTVFDLTNPVGVDGSTDPLSITTFNNENNVVS